MSQAAKVKVTKVTELLLQFRLLSSNRWNSTDNLKTTLKLKLLVKRLIFGSPICSYITSRVNYYFKGILVVFFRHNLEGTSGVPSG